MSAATYVKNALKSYGKYIENDWQKWCPLCKKQIFCTLQNEQENTNISFIEGWKLKISTSVKKAMENDLTEVVATMLQ